MKVNKNEIWKDVKGYEGIYQVSNIGRVKSLNYNRTGVENILKPGNNRRGYLTVVLHKGNIPRSKKIHRLICESFIPNPENKETVNHINGIKTDNRLVNLEWASIGENSKHAFSIGLKNVKGSNNPMFGRTGDRNPNSKKVNRYSISNEYIDSFSGMSEAERLIGISSKRISECCNNKRKSAGGFIFKFEQI